MSLGKLCPPSVSLGAAHNISHTSSHKYFGTLSHAKKDHFSLKKKQSLNLSSSSSSSTSLVTSARPTLLTNDGVYGTLYKNLLSPKGGQWSYNNRIQAKPPHLTVGPSQKHEGFATKTGIFIEKDMENKEYRETISASQPSKQIQRRGVLHHNKTQSQEVDKENFDEIVTRHLSESRRNQLFINPSQRKTVSQTDELFAGIFSTEASGVSNEIVADSTIFQRSYLFNNNSSAEPSDSLASTEAPWSSAKRDYRTSNNYQSNNDQAMLSTDGTLLQSSRDRSVRKMTTLDNTVSDEGEEISKKVRSGSNSHRISCAYHTKKKGKYLANENSTGVKLIVCSRCAIEMTSKGFSIEDLFWNIEEQMNSAMSQLVNGIQQKLPEYVSVIEQLRSQRERVLITSHQIALHVEESFMTLEKELMERKNQVMRELFNEKSSRERVFSMFDEEARRLIDELGKISSDVLLHHESILQNIEMDSFTKIMQQHIEKVAEVQLFFSNLHSTTIPVTTVRVDTKPLTIQKLFDVKTSQCALLLQEEPRLEEQMLNDKRKIMDLPQEIASKEDKSLQLQKQEKHTRFKVNQAILEGEKSLQAIRQDAPIKYHSLNRTSPYCEDALAEKTPILYVSHCSSQRKQDHLMHLNESQAMCCSPPKTRQQQRQKDNSNTVSTDKPMNDTPIGPTLFTRTQIPVSPVFAEEINQQLSFNKHKVINPQTSEEESLYTLSKKLLARETHAEDKPKTRLSSSQAGYLFKSFTNVKHKPQQQPVISQFPIELGGMPPVLKQQMSASRTFFSCQQQLSSRDVTDEQLQLESSISRNGKYNQILESINTNQARNNQFYSELVLQDGIQTTVAAPILGYLSGHAPSASKITQETDEEISGGSLHAQQEESFEDDLISNQQYTTAANRYLTAVLAPSL